MDTLDCITAALAVVAAIAALIYPIGRGKDDSE